MFNQSELIKTESNLVAHTNDNDNLIQSIAFSCRVSLLQAGLFGNNLNEYHFFSDVEGISDYFMDPNSQQHSNFILMPNIISNGSGSIYTTVLKMDAFASSSGPLISSNADCIRFFLELYESIENMVFTIFLLYPPEFAPVSDNFSPSVQISHDKNILVDLLDNCML